jgi:hypothetical protein
MDKETIINNLAYGLPDATRYHFGVLSSMMHMAWVRYTAGRLKSDYRYSNQLVYNNFPWPEDPSEKHRSAVADAAQDVLDARKPYLDDGATLADLYDPVATPQDLVKAHRKLDKAVDLAYRPQTFPSETHRVSFLFDRYEAITNALFAS